MYLFVIRSNYKVRKRMLLTFNVFIHTVVKCQSVMRILISVVRKINAQVFF